MMILPPFKLERSLAEWEFVSPYLLILNTPHNPTGAMLDRTTFVLRGRVAHLVDVDGEIVGRVGD